MATKDKLVSLEVLKATTQTDVNDLKSATLASIDFEIGVNRFVSGNAIAKVANTKRASTDVMKPLSQTIRIMPKSGYTVSVFALQSDSTWTEVASTLSSNTTVNLGNATYYFLQILSNTDIPSDVIPAEIAYDYAKANTSIINDMLEYANVDIIYEAGINRFLSEGRVVSDPNALRGSTVPVQVFANEILIDVKGDYAWTLYTGVDETEGYTEVETLIKGAKEVEINYGSYIFLSLRQQDGSAVPLDDEPIQITVKAIYPIISEQANRIDEALLYSAVGINYSVILANGTLANPANANAVNTSNYIPVEGNAVAKCIVDREPSVEGNIYLFAYRVYDESKSIIKENANALTGNQKVEIPSNGAYVRFAIFESDGNGNFTPLRTTNVNSEDIKINIHIDSESESIVSLNKAKKAQAKIIKLKKINGESYGECDAKFIFATDIHNDTVRTARMVELVNSWGEEYASAVLNGGDTVQIAITESLNWFYNEVDKLEVPLLNTVGNHDAWNSLNGDLAPQTTVYEKIIDPIVSDSGITQPSGADENGYNYYYKDFNNTVRLIVIDCMYWDATQLSWFEGVLESARTSGLHVLVMTHASFPWANMETVDCLWSKAGMLTNYSDSGAINDPTRTPIAAAGAVKTFIDGGGKFVCWLTGHQHGDDLHKLPDYNNQMVVTMGSFAQRASMLQKSDNQADYNYDCLTYIAVDCSNKCIKFLRIGADIDMYGIKHDGLSIRYDRTDPIVTAW